MPPADPVDPPSLVPAEAAAPWRIVVRRAASEAPASCVAWPRHCGRRPPTPQITVIGNTGDDITLYGLRVCPDLDTVMYTLGGGIDEEQGWGRADETFHASRRSWPPTASSRSGSGSATATSPPTSSAPRCWRPATRSPQVTEALCARWQPGVRLLPMSDDRVETHVVVADEARRPGAIHFQEWWVRLRAASPPSRRARRRGRRQARARRARGDRGRRRRSCRRPTRW